MLPKVLPALAVATLALAACTPPLPRAKARVIEVAPIPESVARGPELEAHFVDDEPLFADALYRGADDDWPIGLSVDVESRAVDGGERALRFLGFHPGADETLTTSRPRLEAWRRTRKLPPGRSLSFAETPAGWLRGYLLDEHVELSARDVDKRGFIGGYSGVDQYALWLTPAGSERYKAVKDRAAGRRIAFTIGEDVFAVVDKLGPLERSGFNFQVIHLPNDEKPLAP